MQDVLDLYAEPYDPEYPVVGFDEQPLSESPDASYCSSWPTRARSFDAEECAPPVARNHCGTLLA
jgi:hypothetical protein